jgi:serine/threonine protein kinase
MSGPEWKLPEPITMAQFDLGVTLGTGSFGRVRFVTHKSTGTHWALKMLKKAEVIRLQQVRTKSTGCGFEMLEAQFLLFR